MKRKNKILTESQKRQIIQDKEKSILESFTKTFNKIKRIDENEIGGKPYSEQEFNEFISDRSEVFSIIEASNLYKDDLVKRIIFLKENGVRIIPNFTKKIPGPKSDAEWWDKRFELQTLFEFVDESTGDVLSLFCNENDWYEGGKILYPESKSDMEFLYRNNLIDGAPKNSVDAFNTDYASADLVNSNQPSLNENSSDTYFETLSETLEYVREQVLKMGYTLDEDDLHFQFGTGGVSYGQTKSAVIPLLKNGEPILGKSGKPLNRAVNIVIYRMDSGRYELTFYKTF